jgi:hypothetical protein
MGIVTAYTDPKSQSIEEQVAFKGLVDLTIANIEIPKDLKYAMWWWARKVMKNHLGTMHGGKPNDTNP